MTDASKDPETFLTQVDDAMDDVEKALDSFLEKSTNLVNTAIATMQAEAHGAWEGIKGGVSGFFHGGIPGAIAGGAQGYVEGFIDELVKQLNEGAQLINVNWEQVSATIRQSIGSMIGDPLKMSSISSHYREAIDDLGQVKHDVIAANNYVEKTWTGRAYTAYSTTSDFQLEALDGTIQTLSDAADLLDDHAKELVVFWAQQLQNLVDLAADIYDKAAEMGDVGNWLTGEAGPIVKILVTAGKDASKILTDTAAYWAEINIGKAGDWDGLQSMLGARGFENDQWPEFTSLDRSQINGPWQTSG